MTSDWYCNAAVVVVIVVIRVQETLMEQIGKDAARDDNEWLAVFQSCIDNKFSGTIRMHTNNELAI
jgi:meiotically up-regulated gene 157 (Mug157) protein